MRNQLIKISFILLLSLSLQSCSDSENLPKLSADATILAFGDSLTSGVGAKKNQAYPKILQNISGFTVINAGISGETTSQGLERFDYVIEKHQPQLIILLEGGNDILRNVNQNEIKKNLAAMIEIAEQKNIPLILIGVPEKKLFSNSAKFYSELAKEYNLVFEKDLLADLLRTPELKSDPIHFNAKGYKKLAEEIYQIMIDNGVVH